MRNLSIKQLFVNALSAVMAVLALAGFCIYQVGKSSDAVTYANESRYASYMLADELRQSSDDLTRLARTYVVSGDPKWEQQYLEVLDIRNGKKPRPVQYEKIYWDFRAAGMDPGKGFAGSIQLVELMKRAGFTEAEFGLLKEAEANSNDLVRTETIAMNMVKGRFDDGAGGFTKQGPPELEKAREMMHNADYHAFKAKIMKPVDAFLIALDKRTLALTEQAEKTKQFWFSMLIGAAVLLLMALTATLWYVYHQITFSLTRAVSASNAMAKGQLGSEITVQGPAEVFTLLQALSLMRDNLVRVVSTVRENSESVATASSEIAQGNNDLSARTEQQASALEETAASMEELSSTVRQNAENALQANALSTRACAIAAQGGEVVGQVIDKMKGINSSSRKIEDIIGVIDSIAFQTNILALNAAVEAARAGEQGRGFAVVASEVRNLAQRSAGAAKEIKALISASVAQVSEGSSLVDKAGETMTEVVQSIRRVADIMGEISAASTEQSQGVAQVNEAVTQMDQATQQNAALVEESAAAAGSLKQQAEQLVEAVSVFHLGSFGAITARSGRHG